MCLDYNIEEKQLLSVFRQYRNDINIYTEDCAKDKSFYELLIDCDILWRGWFQRNN